MFPDSQLAPELARVAARRDVGEGQLSEERFTVKAAAATEVLSGAHQQIALTVHPEVVRGALVIALEM